MPYVRERLYIEPNQYRSHRNRLVSNYWSLYNHDVSRKFACDIEARAIIQVTTASHEWLDQKSQQKHVTVYNAGAINDETDHGFKWKTFWRVHSVDQRYIVVLSCFLHVTTAHTAKGDTRTVFISIVLVWCLNCQTSNQTEHHSHVTMATSNKTLRMPTPSTLVTTNTNAQTRHNNY